MIDLTGSNVSCVNGPMPAFFVVIFAVLLALFGAVLVFPSIELCFGRWSRTGDKLAGASLATVGVAIIGLGVWIIAGMIRGGFC